MRNLSPELIAQLYSLESTDPFLVLVTLSHPSLSSPIRLVRNSEDVTSRGMVFKSFPFSIVLPVDDGESAREVSMDFDNVSLEIIEAFRSVTDSIAVKVEMILASLPNDVQISLEEMKIINVTYDKSKIKAKMILDDFLNTSLSSEQYTPQLYPGLFG